jgi:hypothetical protein
MARQGEATNGARDAIPDDELTVPSLADYALEESRRHRAVTELALPDATRAASTIPPGSKDATGMLTDELREGLWAAIASYLFVAPEADAWAGARPTLHRVWTSPPIGADVPPDHGDAEMPDDVADLIEEWFSIAKDGEVYALVETVLASLPDAHQVPFASACNLVLERGLSDHRFVGRRLMPIASKSDVATIERALAAARSKRFSEAEGHLLAGLDFLAAKPEADPQATVREAVRAVQATAFALTNEHALDLADTLDVLEERGFIDRAIKARHAGLFTWVGINARRPRAEDARLILVTCAGFVTHLASLF